MSSVKGEQRSLDVYYSYQVRGKILNNLNKECEEKQRILTETMKNHQKLKDDMENRNKTLKKNYSSERDRINKWNHIKKERILKFIGRTRDEPKREKKSF